MTNTAEIKMETKPTEFLSDEQIAGVFHLYYKSQVQWKTFGNITWAYPATHIFKGLLEGLMRSCQLMLAPLNKITLIDAIQVAKLYNISIDEKTAAIRTKTNDYSGSKKTFAQLYYTYNDGEEKIVLNFDKEPGSHTGNNYYRNHNEVRQFLIDNHYLVPLYFGPNHPYNGYTAADLTIAVDRTQIRIDDRFQCHKID